MMSDVEAMRMQRDVLRTFGNSRWALEAFNVICRVHDELPKDATLKDRMKAVDAAYPFGLRRYHPYKQWCKVRSAYLTRYGYRAKQAEADSLPLIGGAA